MSIYTKFTVIIFSTLLSLCAQAVDKSHVIGLWLSEEKDGVIKISKESDKYVGHLVWLEPPIKGQKQEDVLDYENPDETLRARKRLGLKLLWNFVFDEDEFNSGELYDPVSGNTYSGKMELESKDVLSLRGYIGIPLFGRSAKWKKIKSIPPSSKDLETKK